MIDLKLLRLANCILIVSLTPKDVIIYGLTYLRLQINPLKLDVGQAVDFDAVSPGSPSSS